MKNLKQYITEKLKITKDNIEVHKKYKYFPNNIVELEQIIDSRIASEGPECDLNDIDISKLDNLALAFFRTNFDGDISEWDVSNVTDIQGMFKESKYTGKNGDISDWNVSNIIKMNETFNGSKFEGDLSKWTLNDKCDTYSIFDDCPLEDQPEKWPKNYET